MRRLVVFGLLLIVLASPLSRSRAGTLPPKAERGVLDLTGWNFDTDGPVALAGEWDFFWQTFLQPSAPWPEPDARIRVPGTWNGTEIEGKAIPGQGFASLHLRVKLQDSPSGLGIKFLDAATAFTAFADGKKIYRSGTPGRDASATKPAYRPGILPLRVTDNGIDLLIHVANFDHWQGGLWEDITIGTLHDLAVTREKKLFSDALLFGSILIMGIYHLFLYKFRTEDPSTLYLGLFCLVTALRPLFHGERFILVLLPDMIGFHGFLKINYILFYLCVPLFSRYTYLVFPRQVSSKVIRLISWAGILAALTPILLPSRIFTALMPGFQCATLAAMGYGTVCVTRAIKAKETDAGIFLTGFAVFFGTIINDILYTRQIIDTTHLVPLGLLAFILCQAVLLARRSAEAFLLARAHQKALEAKIAQNRQMEQALLDSERRFRAMADFMPIPMIETDTRLTIVYANKTGSNWFGYTDAEMSAGLSLTTVLAEASTRDPDRLAADLEQNREILVTRKDGTTVWAQIEIAPIQFKRHFMGYRMCFVDLTRRKEAEAASLHAAEEAKYILVGQVAGKMAHDFNNILSAIMGNAELALMDCADPDLKENLTIIFEQTRRGQMLTQNLVAFAEDQAPREECLNINKTLDLVLYMLRRDLEGIAVKTQFCETIPEVMADAGMIEQSLVNIIQNAIHAMSKTVRPQLAISTHTESSLVCIEISDNGCGIPEAFHKEIYTPSFTLKGSRDKRNAYQRHIKGTGYGMANVKKYMDKHNATVSFTSAEGRGTTFTLRLPATARTCIPAEEETQIVLKGVAGKKILVVEDEDAIQKIFCNILTHPPFDNEVSTAKTGRDAIALLDQMAFDLISLDYMLPGTITGMDVYNHLRKTAPHIPVIFVSGNMEFIASIQGLIQKDPHLDHLPKPCDNLTYGAAIEQWLGAS